MNLDKVHEFLKSHPTCVIARVNLDGGASAATVGFSCDDDCKILIATNKDTRKYKDITKNAKVAIVVGLVSPVTVQYEGIAKEVSVEELGERLNKHFEKVPAARSFAGEEGQTYFLITPTWLRYSNVVDESESFETEQF